MVSKAMKIKAAEKCGHSIKTCGDGKQDGSFGFSQAEMDKKAKQAKIDKAKKRR